MIKINNDKMIQLNMCANIKTTKKYVKKTVNIINISKK